MVAADFEVSERPVLVQAPHSAPILANADSVRRILENLVDNAHKYGRPPVRVEVEPSLGGVTIWVVDSGPGIAPDNRQRIFQRFSRLGPHRGQPGLGLGLPIVRGLAESFGGSVTVEDAPTGGCPPPGDGERELRLAGHPYPWGTWPPARPATGSSAPAGACPWTGPPCGSCARPADTSPSIASCAGIETCWKRSDPPISPSSSRSSRSGAWTSTPRSCSPTSWSPWPPWGSASG